MLIFEGETIMAKLKPILMVIAALAILFGLIWVGQGTGIFPYPASSFMVRDISWAYRGAALVVVGIIAIVWLRRPKSPE